MFRQAKHDNLVSKLREEIKILECTIDDLMKEKIMLLAKCKEVREHQQNGHQTEAHHKRNHPDDEREERATRTKYDQMSQRTLSTTIEEHKTSVRETNNGDWKAATDDFTKQFSVADNKQTDYDNATQTLNIQSLRELPQSECILKSQYPYLLTLI